ncbi:MAG: glycosyltransferase family 2 protein [Candidatus Omnitrophica bacterium]|nr:glycosyltransferase family 2 protein [Candidatus Omnitrophota bacterium]
MRISVVIPVYNEVDTISKIIDDVLSIGLEVEREIIVVDDNSTDGTKEFLEKLNKREVTALFHSNNRGKTAAIKTALAKASGEVIIIQDADLEYPPSENYKVVLEPFIRGYADVVYGSRFLGVHRVFLVWHYFANKFLTTLANVLYNTTLTDMETGVKAFRAEVLKNINLTSKRFGFEPEITAKVFKKNLRVYEVPIVYCGRTYQEGKKIKPIDGIKAIWSTLRYRFLD